MATVPLERARVFYDGVINEPRIGQCEGVAVSPIDGSVWCGTGSGDLVRIAPDGASAERVGSTGGFLLGLDFDAAGNLYACEMKYKNVYRFLASSQRFEPYLEGFRIPNVPCVDRTRNLLYISDSHDYQAAGPGIYRYDLSSGKGGLWYEAPLHFANGLALSADGTSLFVAESGAKRISRIEIAPDGSASGIETWVPHVPNIPDGLAWDAQGALLIAMYEPSRLYRVRNDRSLELFFDDPDAQIIAHPANVARRGNLLFTSNLGRWHITSIDISGY